MRDTKNLSYYLGKINNLPNLKSIVVSLSEQLNRPYALGESTKIQKSTFLPRDAPRFIYKSQLKITSIHTNLSGRETKKGKNATTNRIVKRP